MRVHLILLKFVNLSTQHAMLPIITALNLQGFTCSTLNGSKKSDNYLEKLSSKDSSDDHSIKKAEKKTKEWGMAPGLLVVTCYSDPASDLAKKHPEVFDEDYATVSCICQNLLLLFESASISAKWSTGPVWKHPQFASTIGIKHPDIEKVVALIFYGFSQKTTEPRMLSSLEEHLIDHTS